MEMAGMPQDGGADEFRAAGWERHPAPPRVGSYREIGTYLYREEGT